MGRTQDALDAYATALELTTQQPERRFIERRMAALRGDRPPS
jgi:predicted RNA polymerase sigma factor